MAIQNASVTSTGSFSSLTISGTTTTSGYITWPSPSLPSGATITSTSLTYTLSTNMSKGSAIVTINYNVSPGTHTMSLGTALTTSIAVSARGGNKNSAGTVSITDITYTVNYTYDDGRAEYTVTFVDYDGRTLKTQTVAQGDSATPPSNPSRVGHTFTGWSGSYTNVQSNTTITATYSINQYTVTFVDYDGTILKTQTVNHGASATPPSDPIRNGYTFTGWSGSYTNVQSNTTITATYSIIQYTVTFVDYNGTILKTQTVAQGESATPPSDPIRNGYTFTGWSGSYTNVQSDTTVTATYTQNSGGGGGDEYTVTFLDYDGTVLKTQTVSPGDSASPPSFPVRNGYVYYGWSESYTQIYDNVVTTALYVREKGVSLNNLLPPMGTYGWLIVDPLDTLVYSTHTIVLRANDPYSSYYYMIPSSWIDNYVTITASEMSPNMRIGIWNETEGYVLDFTDVTDYKPGYSIYLERVTDDVEYRLFIQVSDTEYGWASDVHVVLGTTPPDLDSIPYPDPGINPDPDPTVTPTIYLGSNAITNLYFGSNAINRVYIGSNILWDNTD